MRLLICAGGTGGGVYPALTVLRVMQESVRSKTGVEFSALWVGGVGGMEADLVKREGIPFQAIQAAGVHGVGLRTLPSNLLRLGRGYRQSQKILHDFRPDVLFFTGGYVAVPMALAGRRVPTALYVPDIEPGLALKTLARFADRIAVTAPPSQAYFARRAELTVTGYPVRPGLGDWSREAAQQALGLSPDLPTLLVFGGSKGARSLNRALLAALPELLREMQVVHLSGQLDWPEVESASQELAHQPETSELVKRYRTFPYLHEEMGAALRAADLVISRAGASSLGEFPLMGLPAILVPYPYAWRYQKINAEYLVQHGAARLIQDSDLSVQLLPVVSELMRDRDQLERMAQAMRSLAQPGAANSIAQLIQGLAVQKTPGKDMRR
ncbi:MAG: undecaprenyldiphospho-muramoylpentapeptide beta-N-acetylglucosaminyltransferase [Chloroflexota bacterium]